MKRSVCVCVLVIICVCLLSVPVGHMGRETAISAGNTHEGRVTRFLLMGCDRSAKLTDSILLVTVNESARQAKILQIPRDTYAEYTQRDYKKINGAMNLLGADGFKDFLSDTLGVKIHYFVVLKLDFFRSLVDDIGGVELEIPQDMAYFDPAQGLKINLKQGKTVLDGEHAEQFIRYRSGYRNADLGRLDAQKIFLRAFAKQCQELSWLAVLRVLRHALTGVQTDLGILDAVRILRVLRSCDPADVPMATLAGQAVQGKSGAWYYVLNRDGACRMLNEYLLPDTPISVQSFDVRGIFEHDQNTDFQRIYRAAYEKLPLP